MGDEDLGRKKKRDTDAKQNPVATKLNDATYKRFLYIADYKDLTLSQLTRAAIVEFVERFDESRKPTKRNGGG